MPLLLLSIGISTAVHENTYVFVLSPAIGEKNACGGCDAPFLDGRGRTCPISRTFQGQ